jgi:SET domain-containing protein
VPKRSYRIGRSSTGLGLFATKPIDKGAFIVAYRGRRIPDAEARRLESRDARYIFEINTRWSIDGSSRRNTARYVNHSCRPNAEAIIRRDNVIRYVARRRIKPDEEITVDYGKDYFNAYIKKSGCRCAACHIRGDVKRSKRPRPRKHAKRRRN